MKMNRKRMSKMKGMEMKSSLALPSANSLSAPAVVSGPKQLQN
jgi:hypothetical protein